MRSDSPSAANINLLNPGNGASPLAAATAAPFKIARREMVMGPSASLEFRAHCTIGGEAHPTMCTLLRAVGVKRLAGRPAAP